MPRKRSSVVDDLILSPWWVSAGLAVVASVAFPIVVELGKSNPILAALKTAAPFVIFALFFISVISAIRAWVNGRMLDLANRDRLAHRTVVEGI